MASARFRAVDAASEPTPFEKARAGWEQVTASRRQLKSKLDGARAALGFAENPPSKGDIASPILQAKAREYLGDRVPNADLLRRELVRLEDQVTQAATTYSIEAAAWRVALDDEARRRAELVRPRHRAAVKRIGQLVEQLSLAVEAERAVRAELTEVGSHALPDTSREFGALNEYNSLLSSWNRRLLAEGALDP